MTPYTDFFAKFASEKQQVLIARTSSFKLGGLEFKVNKGKRNTPYAVPITEGRRKNWCGAIALSTLEVRQDPNERKKRRAPHRCRIQTTRRERKQVTPYEHTSKFVQI